jgi:hypothetical protein
MTDQPANFNAKNVNEIINESLKTVSMVSRLIRNGSMDLTTEQKGWLKRYRTLHLESACGLVPLFEELLKQNEKKEEPKSNIIM